MPGPGRGGRHCMDEAASDAPEATLQGWVRGSSCPGCAPPPAPAPAKRSFPPCPPSSPSLNSPTASIDVLLASPSPAQPDSTWERQVKAAGPWEGSSCAPQQRGLVGRGHSAKPPPPKRDLGPGAAGRCFLAHPRGNQRSLGEDEAFSRPSQGLHGSVNTFCFQVHDCLLLSSSPCSKPKWGPGALLARKGSLHLPCKLLEPAPKARARLACFFPAAGPSASPCAFTSGLCLCPNYGAAQLGPGGWEQGLHAGEVPELCQGVGCSKFCKGSGTFPEAHSSFLLQDIVWQPQRCRMSPRP